MKIEKLTPWLPLAIVAGYFLFLVATWQRFVMDSKRINDLLAKVKVADDSNGG